MEMESEVGEIIMGSCDVILIRQPISYSLGMEIQKKAREYVAEGNSDGVLILLQHTPVITMGRAGGKENLLYPKSYIESLGVEVIESDRGGNITYHGPGQLVGYPIMNLKKFQEDAHWYYSQLEEVLIKCLGEYGIKAGRKVEYPGVWVDDKKIAALGINVKRWITTHGFSLNISRCKEPFKMINPCGIKNFGVASLDDFLENPTVEEVSQKVLHKFAEVFQLEIRMRPWDFFL